jgi:hypothetical protein
MWRPRASPSPAPTQVGASFHLALSPHHAMTAGRRHCAKKGAFRSGSGPRGLRRHPLPRPPSATPPAVHTTREHRQHLRHVARRRAARASVVQGRRPGVRIPSQGKLQGYTSPPPSQSGARLAGDLLGQRRGEGKGVEGRRRLGFGRPRVPSLGLYS